MKKGFILPFLLIALVGCGQINPDPTPTPTPDPPGPTPGSLWDTTQDSLRVGEKTIDFYSFNDFHGSTEYIYDNDEPGINRLATYIKERQALNPNGFVLTSSGDMWQGSADSNITKGSLVIDWMNELKFSAQAVGNHEFDWTIDKIKENQTKMNFPLLACNIIDKASDKPVDWVKPYTTITRNGVHIGIIGSIGEGITKEILSTNVKDVYFCDPEAFVTTYANYLKENGADMILYLTHQSLESVSSKIQGCVNAVFGGHSHQDEKDNYTIPMLQSACNGKRVGHIALKYNFSTKTVNTNKCENLWTYASDLQNYKEDPTTKAIYDDYLEKTINVIKNEVVSTYTGGISRSNVPYVYNQYAYKYYLDNDSEASKYDIFAVETNNARAEILPSSSGITYGQVYKALPFDNYLTLCSIKGSYIRSLCNYSYSHFYCPKSKKNYDAKGLLNETIESSKTYYMLIINYISISTEFNVETLTVLKTYDAESALPRNILKTYLNGYPNNVVNI